MDRSRGGVAAALDVGAGAKRSRHVAGVQAVVAAHRLDVTRERREEASHGLARVPGDEAARQRTCRSIRDSGLDGIGAQEAGIVARSPEVAQGVVSFELNRIRAVERRQVHERVPDGGEVGAPVAIPQRLWIGIGRRELGGQMPKDERTPPALGDAEFARVQRSQRLDDLVTGPAYTAQERLQGRFCVLEQQAFDVLDHEIPGTDLPHEASEVEKKPVPFVVVFADASDREALTWRSPAEDVYDGVADPRQFAKFTAARDPEIDAERLRVGEVGTVGLDVAILDVERRANVESSLLEAERKAADPAEEVDRERSLRARLRGVGSRRSACRVRRGWIPRVQFLGDPRGGRSRVRLALVFPDACHRPASAA